MHIADVIWWSYTIFLALTVLFMLYFGRKVQQEKGE
jgi:hypothetical protein